MRQAVCSIVVAGLATVHAYSSQQPGIRTGTTGVVIDVAVFDRNGQPVVDLRPEEFELEEEGDRQKILSITLVQRGAVTAGGSAPAAAPTQIAQPSRAGDAAPVNPLASPTDRERIPSVTAILFDRLSPEARPLAGRAAQAYVSTLVPPHDYAGVFLADLNLVTFQPFTNEPKRLLGAVERLVSAAPSSVAHEQFTGPRRSAPVDPNQPVTAGAESAAGWINPDEREKRLRQSGPEGMLARMELRMEEGYRQFVAEYGGHASVAGLRAAVDSLGAQRGRKSILYFTESLPLPDDVKRKFDEVIGRANRANVTVYAVDAAGLRVHSEEARVNRNVALAGAQGLGDATRRDGPWTKELEHQAQLLSSRPSAALGRLAKETGGFVIENTNDLAAGVARMQRERTTYYLLAYQPTNANMDGKFREVSVKVKRPRMTVRARPGYLAVPLSQPQ